MFASRAVKANDGRLMPMEDIPSEHVLAMNGADLIIARNEQSVLSNTVFISGEIPRESYEKHSPHKFAQHFQTPMLIIHNDLDFRVWRRPNGRQPPTSMSLSRRGSRRVKRHRKHGRWAGLRCLNAVNPAVGL
jgi:hypothetical protein